MTPEKLAALRSRISAEPAGPWLDCIVAQFALGWRWGRDMQPPVANDLFEGCEFLYDEHRGATFMKATDGVIWSFPGFRASEDHNACFAALAALEKRITGFGYAIYRHGQEEDGEWDSFIFYLHKNEGTQYVETYKATDKISLPLAAARAIALAAVDNGVDVEL